MSDTASILAGSPGPALAAHLATLDPATLPADQAVQVLKAWSRQRAHDHARLSATIARVAALSRAATRAGGYDPVGADGAALEVAAALTWTDGKAATEIDFAQTLLALPGVYEAFAGGRIDHGKAWVFVDVLGQADLTDAQLGVVCGRLLPPASGWTAGQLRSRLVRAVLAVDPEWAARRYRRALSKSSVHGYLAPDGTATITATGLPAEEAAAACARVDGLAEALRRHGHPGPINRIRTKVFCALLDGRLTGLSRAEIITALLADHTSDSAASDSAAPGGPVSEVSASAAEAEGIADGDLPTPAAADAGASSSAPGGSAAVVDDAGQSAPPAGPSLGGPQIDGRRADGPCADGPCADGPCAGEPCADGPCAGEPCADGLVAGGPLADGRRSHDSAAGDLLADDLPRADGAVRGEPRTGPRRDGGPPEGDGPPDAACPAPAPDPGPRPGPPPGAAPASAGVEVRVGLAALLGLDARPAEIRGWGPVGIEVARRLLARQRGAEWRYALLDDDGHLALGGLVPRPVRPVPGDVGPSAYGGIVEIHLPVTLLAGLDAGAHPGWAPVLRHLRRCWADRARLLAALDAHPDARLVRGTLARHLALRDRTCTAPGCRRPAAACQYDHTDDHATGGATVGGNTGPLCWPHHAIKHHTGWRLAQPRPGWFRWTSPLGQVYDTRGEPHAPPLPDALPRPTADAGADGGGPGPREGPTWNLAPPPPQRPTPDRPAARAGARSPWDLSPSSGHDPPPF